MSSLVEITMKTIECFLLLLSFCTGRTSLDFKDRLLDPYLAACGPAYLCDESLTNVSIDIDYKRLELCPRCQCDTLCSMRGDCCPDLFFKRPNMSCTNTTIFRSNKKYKETDQFFYMSSSCDPALNSSYKERCERLLSLKEQFLYLPVSSTDPLISYKNKFCAYCNGVVNFEEWSLDIECERTIIEQDYLDIDSLESAVRSNGCKVRFRPNTKEIPQCRVHATGLLLDLAKSDPMSKDPTLIALESACLTNYSNTFFWFHNIFCYLATYYDKETKTTKFSNCSFAPELEKYCRQTPKSPATYPYKNIFCYLCDKQRIKGVYNDANVSLYDVYFTGYQFRINLIGIRLNTAEYHMKTLQTSMTDFTAASKYRSILWRSRHMYRNAHIPLIDNAKYLDISSLLSLSWSLSPKMFCNPNKIHLDIAIKLSKLMEVWNCEPDCMSTVRNNNITCSTDMALTYPMACGNPKMKYVDACYNVIVRPALKQRCENPTDRGLLRIIPIYTKRGTTYRSYDCFLCNTWPNNITQSTVHLQDHEILHGAQATSLQLLCDTPVNFMYYDSLQDILDTTWSGECSVHFIANHNTTSCRRKYVLVDHKFFGKCNITGRWTVFNQDVKWACESLLDNSLPRVYKTVNGIKNEYRNEFCEICNPMESALPYINKCPLTENSIMHALSRACEIFPMIQTYYPYKNVFCFICNNRTGYTTQIERTLRQRRFILSADLVRKKVGRKYSSSISNS